jgi:hypothetical protein
VIEGMTVDQAVDLALDGELVEVWLATHGGTYSLHGTAVFFDLSAGLQIEHADCSTTWVQPQRVLRHEVVDV